jgi:homoserine kinase
MISGVRAYAPGTVANVGPGFDVLGMALTGAGDLVTAIFGSGGGIEISCTDPEIPTDPSANTAGIAARAVLRMTGPKTRRIVLSIRKGLPLSGGQGGSAASACAAAVAVNALLGARLSREKLLEACLEAETAVAGRHADNVAPCLYGGLVLARSLDPLDIVRLGYPKRLLVVLAEPRLRLETGEARRRLPASVPRQDAVAQAANLAAMVTALERGDFELLSRALEDHIGEPARVPLLRGFVRAKRAALDAGARGCSVSGSGPTAFAFASDAKAARRIASAMGEAYRAEGVDASVRIAKLDSRGARPVRRSAG